MFRSPQNRGFPSLAVLVLAVCLPVADGAVRSSQPHKDFTDYFQYAQRVSPKWFHNDLLFKCMATKVGGMDN